VCLHATDSIVNSRASAAYEKAMADLKNMSDPAWYTLLRNLLIEYVTLITNPEGPALSAPNLMRKEIRKRDAARKDARTAARPAAAAANPGDDCEGAGGGADGDCDDCDEASGPYTSGPAGPDTSGPATKAGRGTGRGREGGPGEEECVSLLWAAFSPGSIAMVARGIKHS
jgi:hypothetical protein